MGLSKQKFGSAEFEEHEHFTARSGTRRKDMGRKPWDDSKDNEPSLPSCPTCKNNRSVIIQNSGSAAQGPWQCKATHKHDNGNLELFARPACLRCGVYGDVKPTMKGDEKEWVCTAHHCGFKFNLGDDPKKKSNYERIREGLDHANKATREVGCAAKKTSDEARKLREAINRNTKPKPDEFTERMKRKAHERKDKAKRKQEAEDPRQKKTEGMVEQVIEKKEKKSAKRTKKAGDTPSESEVPNSDAKGESE